MGEAGIVENTKTPGGLLGGCAIVFVGLLLVIGFISFLFWLFGGEPPQ